ncbi:MAG TPA: response regulator [Candidatus Angelobacter sp.]|nr:response regulator [Candidatus Angelobacter sp.]
MSKNVILIEDDPVTVKFTGDILARIAPEVRLEVIRDGHNALTRLLGHGEIHDPIGLIILDLNIPQLHGVELLRELKTRAETRYIPIVVISGTASPAQSHEVYALGANGYVIKVTDPKENKRNIEAALNYWVCVNVLPASNGTNGKR